MNDRMIIQILFAFMIKGGKRRKRGRLKRIYSGFGQHTIVFGIRHKSANQTPGVQDTKQLEHQFTFFSSHQSFLFREFRGLRVHG